MINRVVLTGRLTRDVELRYTQSGTAVASFVMAVDRSYTNSNGDREADFINAVIWRKPAENFANFFGKGSLVGIDGRLQSRSYEDQNKQRRYVTEVVVESFTFLESRSDSDARRNKQNENTSYTRNNNSNPFGEPAPTNNSGNNSFIDSQEIDISDDDLPF